jgi:hypothetical protein
VATDFFLCFPGGSNGGALGVESRVPTSLARQCLCRGPTLLVFGWVFAFSRQVGDAPVLFEKSVLVL